MDIFLTAGFNMNINVNNPRNPKIRVKHLFVVFIFTLATMLSACSTPVKQASPKATTSSLFPKSTGQSNLQRRLSNHFKSWQHTPYQLGGNSRNGIDCSGFVQVTYRAVFNKKIPRSTTLQGKVGQIVSRKSLRLGDLVFFQTGRRQRHVGIYIGNNRFIHASTSRGVMLSKLDSPYWSRHYWKATRILNI